MRFVVFPGVFLSDIPRGFLAMNVSLPRVIAEAVTQEGLELQTIEAPDCICLVQGGERFADAACHASHTTRAVGVVATRATLEREKGERP